MDRQIKLKVVKKLVLASVLQILSELRQVIQEHCRLTVFHSSEE